MDWKWSNGETYYKSPREYNKKEEYNKTYDSAQNAINQSLYQEEIIDMLSSKREELDDKLSNREMVFQRGTNPFSSTSYVNDVIVRDMFLKPINTTQGKVKEEANKLENNS